MKKKITACLLIFAMLLSLTACSADGKYQKQCEHALSCLEAGQWEEAITAYTKAIELDSEKPEAYIGRGNVYLALAEDSEDPEENLTLAQADYEMAVSLDGAGADAWQTLADICTALGNQDAVLEVLERGIQATSDAQLETRLQDLKIKMEAQTVLGSIPYFGDLSQCTMTAEQATAYAQLIANGIEGKNEPFSGYGYPATEVVFWEEPYTVYGYSVYQTDRAHVILGDFEGNGNPYLYVFSSLTDEGSFEVYGWDGQSVQLVTGEEAYQGRQYGYLMENEEGRVELVEGGTAGAASHGANIYSFQGGTTVLTYSWDETFDYESELWVVTINGVETTYSQEEYEAYNDAEYEGSSDADAVRTLTYAPFADVEAQPFTLREMIDGLNRYAAVLSGGSAPTVTVQEPTGEQRMAKAMLSAIAGAGELTYARLLDMDGNGTQELILGWEEYDGGYRKIDRARLYTWDGTQLNSSADLPSYTWLCKVNGQYALVADVGAGGFGSYEIYYATHTDRLNSASEEEVVYEGDFSYVMPGGDPTLNGQAISQEEYRRIVDSMEHLERLFDQSGFMASYLSETQAALNSMLKG